MKKSVLYIINFYGSPPLNYFEKYLQESDAAFLTILKLPSVRAAKNRLHIDAFIKDESGKIHPITINLFFPLPYFFTFIIQYLFNFILAFVLLGRINRKKFDIAIGETNFGSALCYILKKLGKAKFSTYMNGDILPDPKSSSKYFFLPNTDSRLHPLYKFVDTLLLQIQLFLRRIGYKNDLIWYGNERIKKWDSKWNLHNKSHIIADPILIDYKEFPAYEKQKKNISALGYIGRIDDYVGLDLIIHSLPIVKKSIPTIKLHIIGGSAITTEKYKKLAEEYNVNKEVIFYGYIPDMSDALKILSGCALGMALYKPVKDNVSMISQPAKPKEYIKVGVPVLVTKDGPAIGQEIVDWKAGIEAQFDTKDVAKKIIKVLTDQTFYNTLRSGVKKYAQFNHYYDKFEKVWRQIIEKSGKGV